MVGGVVGQLVIVGLGGQEVGFDEVVDFDCGVWCCVWGEGGDLDWLFFGWYLCDWFLFGLYCVYFGYCLLGLVDLGLLLLL